MLKLLLCIFSALAIAGTLLHLKHEKSQINYHTNLAHKRLQNLQIELWNQQLQVAIYTAPNAIENTVGSHHLDLEPALDSPASAAPAAGSPTARPSATPISPDAE